jgi:hypothetical protein
MEHALTPVLKKIFKPRMLIYFCYLPNPFLKSVFSDNSAAAAQDTRTQFFYKKGATF